MSANQPPAAHGGPQRVDELCAALFLSPHAQDRDDNLLFVRERLLRSELDLAGLLDLYGQVRRGRRVPDDETNPLISILRLSGITRVAAGALHVRNRIYARVFDQAWVTAHMPDAELRRQRAAYRQGRLRTALAAGVVIALMGVLTAWALRSRDEARHAARASQKSEERARTAEARALEQGQDALARARSERSAAKLAFEARARAESEKSKAREAEQKADKSARLAALGEQRALDAKSQEQRAKIREHQAARNTRELLSESQAERGARLLTDGDALGLLHLLQACETAADLPAARSARAALWARWAAPYSGRLLQVLGHEDTLSTIRFSPGGELIVTLSNHTARLWETATGRLRGRPFPHGAGAGLLQFSPDGKLLVTVSGNAAQLWETATGKPRGEPLRHADRIEAVQFRPDGALLATGSRDRTVQLWETATGRRYAPPLRQPNHVHVLAFSPDGKRLATGSCDKTIRVWELAGRPKDRLLGIQSNELDLVLFSPDGKLLATRSTDHTVRLWETATGRARGQPMLHEKPVSTVLFSPDGTRLLTVSGQEARLWATETDEAVSRPLRQSGEVSGAAFSPDGRLLAIAAVSLDGKVQLWDPATGQPRRDPLQHPSTPVTQLAFSPDGKLLATGSSFSSDCWLWDTTTWQLHGPPLRYQGAVSEIAFSPDGRSLAVASFDRSVRLWATETGQQPERSIRHQAPVNGVAISPDGRLLASASGDRTARLWSVATGEAQSPPLRHREFVNFVAFSPDGTLLATTAGDAAQLWETATGKPRGPSLPLSTTVSGAPVAGFTNRPVFSPDGRLLATASGETVSLWTTASGTLHGAPIRHDGPVIAVAFSPDGRLLATATLGTRAGLRTGSGPLSGAIRLWETASGRPFGHPLRPDGLILGIAFSPDGKRVAAAVISMAPLMLEGTVRQWRITGQPYGKILRHPSALTVALAYSPDGRLLATSSLDATVRLWEIASGTPRGQPLRHAALVTRLAFSPDGKLLATGSTDGMARLWETGHAQPYGQPLRHEGQVNGVAFDPQGRLLATASGDGTARLWRLPGAPAGRREIALRTWVALGARLNAQRSVEAIPGREWRKLRDELSAMETAEAHRDRQKRGGPSPALARSAERWWAWSDRGDAHTHKCDWEQAAVDYSRAIQSGPADWAVWSSRGDAYASLGQWSKAVADYERAIQAGAQESWRQGCRIAMAHLALDDISGYRRACRTLIERFGQTADPTTANMVAWTCSLAPGALEDLSGPMALAEKAAATPTGSSMLTMGAVLYRAGRFDAAVQRLGRAIAAQEQDAALLSRLFLSMAQQRLGHREEARRALSEAVGWMEQAGRASLTGPPRSPLAWQFRVQARQLRREAEALIQ